MDRYKSEAEVRKFSDIVQQIRSLHPQIDEETVKKEILHTDILTALDREGFLRLLTFQGGTSLHLMYGSPRFSEDLDFAGGRGIDFQTVNGFGECVMDYVGSVYNMSMNLKDKIRPGEHTGMRVFEMKFETNPENRHIPRRMKKVEIAACEAFTRENSYINSCYDFMPANLNDLIIATQAPEEILADKLLALPAAFNASSSDWVNIRYRDFFDIWFLQHQLGAKFDPEMLQKKIDDYAVKNYEQAVANTVENIQGKMERSGGYIDHVARYFPPALFRDISASCHLDTHVDIAIAQLREVQEMMFERSYTA